MKEFIVKGVIALACLGMVVLLVYAVFLRPWFLRMGAGNDEVAMKLPGDEMTSGSGFNYTQAITVKAPKDIVWSYLIQVGYKRAGWYNIDQINGLIKDYFYEGGKSASRIIPELQGLKEGDLIYLNPGIPGFKVSKLEKESCMLLTAEDAGNSKEATPRVVTTWVFKLQEVDKNTTRLIVRWRSQLSEGISGFIFDRFMDVGSAGLQQPAMLRGLKKRAEAEFTSR